MPNELGGVFLEQSGHVQPTLARVRGNMRLEKAVFVKESLDELNKLLAKGYRINYMLTPEIALVTKDL